MFYKIQSNLFPGTLPEIIDALKDKFNCLYVNRSIYICQSEYDPELVFDKKQFGDQYFVTDLTENDLNYEDEQIISWFNENRVRLFNEKIELEHQDKLINMIRIIDGLDEEIEKMKASGEYDRIMREISDLENGGE